MENLSDELLVEILVRTSEKDAMRCKCVCKFWYHIISEEEIFLGKRFWANSPIAGIYFRTPQTTPGPTHLSGPNSHYRRKAYINFLVEYSDFSDIKFVSLPPERERERNELSWVLVDYCNGLELVFADWRYIVFNPTTKQRSYIPKALHHSREHGKFHLFAALAFDPIESLHYRVVRLSDPKPSDASVVLHMFSSETGLWVRHHLLLDTIVSWNSIMCFRHFTYFHGVLYWIVSSSKILCIDLDNLADGKTPTRVLHVPDCDEDVAFRLENEKAMIKASAMGRVGCLGVSMNHIYYCTHRRKSGLFAVWFYNVDASGNGHGEWVLKFSVSYIHLKHIIVDQLSFRLSRALWIQPVAVGPNADVLFIGTNKRIFSYHLESDKLQLVCKGEPNRVVDCCFFPLFLLRKCICPIPFYKLGEETAISTPLTRASDASDGEEILSMINSEVEVFNRAA
ncbi:hypothetical protein FEM48_Zijuj02G0148300 [Ziziphus jujuba var. spinosa]|uniref:F-box domain-containing protein n=1 Tax=Ziziphus jujuba var. spinosa TaxID=714518 RepID=A0A978VWB4_ZIZJJ|nr:hypothetical protein FEM48_Zijuj02G0148300 [Ziziphus jujuba var. spinosa]